jgi:cytidylate kinase
LSGQDVDANLDRIYREILERDARDASREVAPLKPADDAHVIDTTGESVAASLAKVRGLVREKGWI